MIRAQGSGVATARMRRLSISLLLSATTGLMAILLIASVCVPVRFSTDQWRRASRAEARVRVAARLFTASEALRAEQRATEAQASRPSAPPPAYPAALATRTDQALDEAFKAYDAASATGANLSPVALRQAVEARRAARGGPAGGAWRVAEDRLAQVVEADAAAALKPTLSDPFLAEMIRVRQMSWAAFLGAQADQAQAEATTPSGTGAGGDRRRAHREGGRGRRAAHRSSRGEADVPSGG